MGVDRNRREAQKPPSFDSRIRELIEETEMQWVALRQLCGALLVEDSVFRRAKLLAVSAAMSETGRGARKQGHGG